MNIRFINSVLLLTLSSSLLAANADQIPFPMTLNSAIKQTLANNPQLHEFEFRQQIITGEAKTAALKPAYAVGVELDNFLGTGAVSGFKDTELTVSLSSVIELGDKIHARKGVAAGKRQQLEVEQQLRSLDILAEVTRRYIDVLAQQETIKAVNEAEQLAQYAYQAVSRRVTAGASPLLEQKRAQAALAQAKLRVTTAKQQLQTSIKSLAIMWGEQQPGFSEVQGNLFLFAKSPAFADVLATLAVSPYIQMFFEQSRVQDAELRLSQANNKLDVSWTAGVRRLNGIDDTALVAGISVPLFSQSRNLGEYEAQKAKVEQIEQQKQTNLRNLYHQVNQALDARNRALLEVSTLQQDVIPPLKQALSLVEKAYADGRFSYLEWVSTRQELLDAQQALIEAAKQAHQRGADLEALTGMAIMSATKKSNSDRAFTATIINEKSS